jgi:2-polyprenyl-3-methyl-5-hydroxy-6-metoxy-1,4-benzoquinol methylase
MEPNLHTDADKYQAGMGSWSKTLAPLFVEFIGVIKEGDRVLDVGCGTGSLTFTIADTTKAATVVGIDPSTGYIEYARHIINIRTLPLKSGMLRNFPMTMALSTAAYPN